MPAPPHDPYAALRVRNVRLYLAGNFLGTMGQQMQELAIGWELYERTHSPLALGFVGLTLVVPVIVLALPAGRFVDHRDRRKVLLATQAAYVLTSVGLALLTLAQGPLW